MDNIEGLLPNQEAKVAHKISNLIDENILIRLAGSSSEYQVRLPNKEIVFQTNPVTVQSKRKRLKKKANVTFKAALIPKKLSPTPKIFHIVKTSEHIIEPNLQESNLRTERKDVIDIKSFFKKFKCILNKLTPENMQVMTSEVRRLESGWSEEILETAVSLIHTNVIRNSTFASVYSEFTMRIADLFPKVGKFKMLILDRIRKTLNLRGDPAAEPKDSIFLSKRLKKVNITKLLGQLYLKKLVDIDDIFKVCSEFIVARAEEISGFREICLECLVDLVTICGKRLQTEDEETLEDMMAQLASMSHDDEIPKRIRFHLDSVVELSNNEWIPSRCKIQVVPQKIEDLRAKFMATRRPPKKASRYLHPTPKHHRIIKPPLKFKKSFASRRPPLKSRKISAKDRGLTKKLRSRPFSSSGSFSGGAVKSKMNYRMATRSYAEKRQIAVKHQMLEKVETVVKSMDSSKMEIFAAHHPNWRTFLLQRLLRKWKLKPYRKAVNKIIEVLSVEAISTTELHEAFRTCGIAEKEFFEDRTVGKVPEKSKKVSYRLSGSDQLPNPPPRLTLETVSQEILSCNEEK